MNPSLNRQLNGLLNATGLLPQKEALVLSVTKERSSSRKDLTDSEAIELINWLKIQPQPTDDSDKMRKKIISMAHECGWHNFDVSKGRWKIDMKRVNNWCVNYSYLKKELNKYSYEELPKLVTQFSKVYRSFLEKF